MRNFKPSELPAGTCIDDKVHGFWTKDSDNAWWMDAPHCVDCAEVVFDGPPTEAEKQLEGSVYQFHTTPSDDFFTEFKIVSVPLELLELAVDRLVHEAQTHCCYPDPDETSEVVFEDLLKTLAATKEAAVLEEKRDVWKHLASFNRDGVYAEINEFGEVRVGETIYKPSFSCADDMYLTIWFDQLGEVHPIDPKHFVKVYFDKDWNHR